MFDTGVFDKADPAALVELIRELEEQKAACAAGQARAASALLKVRVAERAVRGVPSAQRDRGVAAEIALARRESPYLGNQHLGFAKAMTEMPHTMAQLEGGSLSEWRATILVRETACLTREDRGLVDAELCSDTTVLAGLGNKAVEAKARQCAARLDVESLVRRAVKAREDRCVSSRPAPDCMAYVSALLPVKDAVTVEATLRRDAASVVATGDNRTPSQIMADLLVERVTGISTATGAPITVNMVISDQALLGDGNEPAHVDGFGAIPAGLARKWVKETDAKSLRRVYASPQSGALTAMESTARCFPKSLAKLIDIRDRTCRTPWCDAPIRHHDHIVDHHKGGPTSADNGAGLCEVCNHAKQAPDWSARPDESKTVERHATRSPRRPATATGPPRRRYPHRRGLRDGGPRTRSVYSFRCADIDRCRSRRHASGDRGVGNRSRHDEPQPARRRGNSRRWR